MLTADLDRSGATKARPQAARSASRSPAQRGRQLLFELTPYAKVAQWAHVESANAAEDGEATLGRAKSRGSPPWRRSRSLRPRPPGRPGAAAAPCPPPGGPVGSCTAPRPGAGHAAALSYAARRSRLGAAAGPSGTRRPPGARRRRTRSRLRSDSRAELRQASAADAERPLPRSRREGAGGRHERDVPRRQRQVPKPGRALSRTGSRGRRRTRSRSSAPRRRRSSRGGAQRAPGGPP